MTDRALSSLTVIESALIDLQQQREAHMARKATFAGSKATEPREPGDTILHPDYVDALCRPVRIEISFDDPIKVRQQIAVLQRALIEAEVVTHQHDLGIQRQRLNLRHVIKTAADVLVLMNGKRPTGQHYRKRREQRSNS